MTTTEEQASVSAHIVSAQAAQKSIRRASGGTPFCTRCGTTGLTARPRQAGASIENHVTEDSEGVA